MKLSGLQREVLSLYRKCLRESAKKPESSRLHFKTYARGEFRKSIKLDKKDFGAIEYLLRKGQRQLEMVKDTIRDQQRRVAKDGTMEYYTLSTQ